MIKKEKQAPNDNRLAEALYEAFHRSKEFQGYDINVTVYNGRVNLQGIVDVLEETKKAEQFARDFPGVKSVENNLTVSTDGAIDDGDIYLEVAQELASNPAVNEEKIHFTVQRGIVTLRGEAASEREREAAACAAAKARGVRSVNNQIRISQSP